MHEMVEVRITIWYSKEDVADVTSLIKASWEYSDSQDSFIILNLESFCNIKSSIKLQ